jgi:alpha-beta hydrolase superfamily lysophospholipase
MRLRRIAWRRLIAGMVLLTVLACNGIAWMQARAMTHFTSDGERTPPIEAMSLPEKAWAVLAGVNVPRPQNTHTPQDVGLQYTVQTISFQNGDSLEAWYIPRTEPRGAVLMFPAYAESKESQIAHATAFHDMGYDILMVDFRGVGGSSGADTTLGVREAKDVARVVEYARQTWPGRPIVLYGVSMGSAAILRAIAVAGVKPDVVIIESPFNRLLDTVRNRFDAMGLPSFPGAELVVFWGGVQQGFDGFAHNPVDYVRSVECPTLLMHGERDSRVTTAQARAIYEQLSGRKEFVSFPGVGHESLLAAAPEMWKEHVAQFLSTELK